METSSDSEVESDRISNSGGAHKPTGIKSGLKGELPIEASSSSQQRVTRSRAATSGSGKSGRVVHETSSEEGDEEGIVAARSRNEATTGGGKTGRVVHETSSEEGDEEGIVAASEPKVENSKKEKRKRHKPIHRTQKTMTQLSKQEVDRVLKILSSEETELPSKLKTSHDLAVDLETNGPKSWIFVNVIKTGQFKNKHKQRNRFLFNLQENENLQEAINIVVSNRLRHTHQNDEEEEEEPVAVEKSEDKEEHFLFSELNVEEYFQTEDVLVLHGNDRDDTLEKHRRYPALRERAGTSSALQKPGVAEPKRPMQPTLLDENALKKSLKIQKAKEGGAARPQPTQAILENRRIQDIIYLDAEQKEFLPKMAESGGVYRGWQIRNQASSSKPTSATTKEPSPSTAAPTSASGSSQVPKTVKNDSNLIASQPHGTAEIQGHDHTVTRPTRGVEPRAAARANDRPQKSTRSHSQSAPRQQVHLPMKRVIIKASDIKKTAKGKLLDKNNQPTKIFENGISYMDLFQVLVTVPNLCTLNSILLYFMDVALDKAGRAFLKKIMVGSHPLIIAFIIEVFGEKQVRIHVTCHMEQIRASLVKFLLLRINNPDSIVKNTSTHFEGTALNLSPAAILNLLTISSITRHYMYEEAQLNRGGRRVICSHIQDAKVRDTAIPYALFRMALETGEIPDVPIKYPCSCGASASIRTILSEDGFFIRFYGRGLNLCRDNIEQDLPLRATLKRMRFRLHAVLVAYFTFQKVAHSMVLIPRNGDFRIMDDGTHFQSTNDANEFSVHALVANYIKDEE